MNRIRLAVSIISLIAVLTFGLTISMRVAQADPRTPECDCDTPSFAGLTCDIDGRRDGFGLYCCALNCVVIAE